MGTLIEVICTDAILIVLVVRLFILFEGDD